MLTENELPEPKPGEKRENNDETFTGKNVPRDEAEGYFSTGAKLCI